MLTVYNANRKRDLNRVYAEGTLGALVAWYLNCSHYRELAERTRKGYEAAYEWLRPEFDCPLDVIDTASLYDVRDRCARARNFIARKTRKRNPEAIVPATIELQEFLASLKVRTPDGQIALRDDGTAWKSEIEMQKRISAWLRSREQKGLIGAGTTLHGLRVTYASWLRAQAPTARRSRLRSAIAAKRWAPTIPATSRPRRAWCVRSSEYIPRTPKCKTERKKCKTFTGKGQKVMEIKGEGGAEGRCRTAAQSVPDPSELQGDRASAAQGPADAPASARGARHDPGRKRQHDG
jgi:hypothetical protein